MDTTMVVSFDARQIISYTQKADRLLATYLRQAASKVESRFPTLFASVVQSAGQASGFPPEYIDHIIEVGMTLGLDVSVTNYGVVAAFDFDLLGTADELESAFHRGAALADGGYVEGPYEGEELKYPREKRQLWWETRVNQPESWKQKVDIWGGSAPEWIYLQFGQVDSPATPPTDFMERLEAGVGSLLRGYMDAAVASALYADSSVQTPVIVHDEGLVLSKSEAAKRQRRVTGVDESGRRFNRWG